MKTTIDIEEVINKIYVESFGRISEVLETVGNAEQKLSAIQNIVDNAHTLDEMLTEAVVENDGR